jgi:ATP-dependent DNA helicase RecG
MALSLESPVTVLTGVGPSRAEHLAQKGISTLEDLLYYLPFRYEDRIHFTSIGELQPGQVATVQGEVLTAGLVRLRGRGRRGIFNLAAGDATGILYAKWFYGDYLQRVFRSGQRVVLHGKVEEDPYRPGQLQMIQPQHEILSKGGESADSTESGRIVPIYEAAGPVTSRVLRRLVFEALRRLPARLPDPLPEELLHRYDYPGRGAALRQAHFPERDVDQAQLQACRTPAQQRLIYEEFLFLQLGLALQRRRARRAPGIPFELNDAIRDAIKKILPFHPTAAQKRVMSAPARPSSLSRLPSSPWRGVTRRR